MVSKGFDGQQIPKRIIDGIHGDIDKWKRFPPGCLNTSPTKKTYARFLMSSSQFNLVMVKPSAFLP